MNTFLRIQKEFNFLTEHLQKATSVAFQQIRIKGFDLRYHFSFLRIVNRETPLFKFIFPFQFLF